MAEHNTFHLIIASVGDTKFEGAAVSATLPATAGEVTILPHHEPYVTTLKPGAITVRQQAGEQKTFTVESGILECANSRVVVLL